MIQCDTFIIDLLYYLLSLISSDFFKDFTNIQSTSPVRTIVSDLIVFSFQFAKIKIQQAVFEILKSFWKENNWQIQMASLETIEKIEQKFYIFTV